MHDALVTQRRDAAAKISSFRIDDDLPDAVKDAALGSGGYPYSDEMGAKPYEKQLYRLQLELLRMLDSVVERRQRVVVLFEGRDAAGKGGTIARLTEHLNPRRAHVVALEKPTPVEAAQWYFQRYVAQLPPRGEIAVFDRSWYNRAVVEPVFGFATPGEVDLFLREAPRFESMLAADGIVLIKIFLSIGREMQMERLHSRHHDPLRRWKLSPLDYRAIDEWDAYTRAIDAMFERTDSLAAPWTIVLANDKRRARLEAIRHVLLRVDYEGKDLEAIGAPDGRLVLSAKDYRERPGG